MITMKKILSSILVTGLLVAPVTGCVSARDGLNDGAVSQVKMRQIQTRAYDTEDKKKVMQGSIATLQDLGFVIDNADLDIGTITATKLSGYSLEMTVSVRPNNQKQMLVRAVARYNETVVEDPKPYQSFFTSLSKGLFLDEQTVSE